MLKRCILMLLSVWLVGGRSMAQDLANQDSLPLPETTISSVKFLNAVIRPLKPALMAPPRRTATSSITRIPGFIEDSPVPVLVIPMKDRSSEFRNGRTRDPGSIAGILHRSTGLQMQTTTATPNAAVLRIRGFNGRYTQVMRDGFPVYGGLGGNFDLLQVSPLELKQIEVLKGPASTSYGGDAAAGAVNLVSREVSGSSLHEILLNASNIGAKDIALFNRREETSQLSFSNFASAHLQSPFDPNRDGFTDLPQINRFRLNPKLHFRTESSRQNVQIGATFNRENRRGGDRDLVKGSLTPIRQNYQEQHSLQRIATQLEASHLTPAKTRIELRNSQSWYSRQSTTREFTHSPDRLFAGKQFNSFTEISALTYNHKNRLNAGLSHNLERFREDFVAEDSLPRDQSFNRISAFAIDRYNLSYKLTLDGGVRAEYVLANSMVGKNGGQLFVLPRLFANYSATRNLRLRLGGSSGYRMPSIFSQESEMLGFRSVLPVNFALTQPERSWGGQAGICYAKYDYNYENLFTLDLQGYYNLIDNLILLQPLGFATAEYLNYDARAYSRGLEARLRIRKGKLELNAGYALNDTYLQDSLSTTALTLVPRHSVNGSFGYRNAENWAFNVYGNWNASQWLLAGMESPAVLLVGVNAERTIRQFTFFLNASNLLDMRQSKDESMLTFPYNTPQFTQVWAPLDGFYFNGGLRIRL